MVRRRTELQNVPRQHLTGKLHTTEELKYTDCERSTVVWVEPSPGESRGFYLTRVLKNSWREFLFSSLRGMLGESFSVLSADCCPGPLAVQEPGVSALWPSRVERLLPREEQLESFLGSGALCWEKRMEVNEMIWLFLCTLYWDFVHSWSKVWSQ